MNRPFARAALLVLAVYFLLFFRLDGVGLLGPDEPRYAAIGREMALSSDWVTPRLWGQPWFEKPALLYWMTGAAFRVGFGDDLAPRLPVAIASLAFLVFFQRALQAEFGRAAAWYAVAVLATSAGWIAYSQLGLTDLPLTAALGASMLLILRWTGSGRTGLLVCSGAMLGLAALAKGLVPFALAAPGLWFGARRGWKIALVPAVAVLTAAPWYIACWLRHGQPFVDDFIWKHHFERFSSDAIQHVQPFWFYVPVLLGGLFPWSAALAVVPGRRLWRDVRLRFLLAWFAFGFVFFSAATNKLPGYLLPLLPPVCAAIGVALANGRNASWALGVAGLLPGAIPAAAPILPDAVRDGLSRANPADIWWWAALPFLGLAALAWRLDRRGRRGYAIGAIAAAAVGCVIYLKIAVYPPLDATVSTRALWRQAAPQRESVCVEPIHRAWRYGLNYYSVEPLPDCSAEPRPLRVKQRPGAPAYLAD
ncbi:MAG: glycosyltransferase family 39 protein [Bryobacteraceae bacterium]|nr:glycosyltransferase family 39 protein [Bryobacteraceae bacterium]